MATFSLKTQTRFPKDSERRKTRITDQELILLQKLKGVSRPKYEILLGLIEQLIDLSSASYPSVSEKDYLNDPLWRLVGKGSSGRSNDDSTIHHDRYLYGKQS